MAAITSLKTGLASDTSVWSSGTIPTDGDKVTIAAGHVVTYDLASRVWGDDTTTAITINGTLKASRSVSTSITAKGHIIFGANGEWDWGKSADPIPLNITATIVLNYSASLAAVKYGLETIDGTKFWSFGAAKTLQAKVVNSDSSYAANAVVNGTFDADASWTKGAGTTISGGKMNINNAGSINNYQAAPAGTLIAGKRVRVTITISNYVSGSVNFLLGSVTTSPGKFANGTYQEILTLGNVTSQNINIQTSASGFVGSVDDVIVEPIADSSGAAGNSWLYVDDHTNWQVGDTIAVQGTSSNNQGEEKTIIGIAGNVITVNGPFAFSHAVGAEVANLSTNVTYKNYNDTYPGYIKNYYNTSQAANTREIQYSTFKVLGTSATSNSYGMSIQCTSLSANLNVFNAFSNNCLYKCYAGLDVYNVPKLVADGNVFWLGIAGVYGIEVRQGACPIVSNTLMLSNSLGSGFYSAYSQGVQGAVITNLRTYGCAYSVTLGAAISATFNDGIFNNNGTVLLSNACGLVTFNRCKCGVGTIGTPANVNGVCYNQPYALNPVLATDCEFQTAGYFVANIANSNPAQTVSIVNKNKDVTQQELYTQQGTWVRDNSVYRNSLSSLKLTTATSSVNTYSTKVNCKNGDTITVAGNIQHDSNYVLGGNTLPSVTISGLGITPVTFNAANNANTWQPYVLQATNNSGADGQFTITFSAQSNTATGNVWFDGLIIPPFITSCRFYGYTEDGSNPLRTVDAYTVASYATAAAYTGIALNYATKTLTITQPHTLQEIYDYIKYSDQLAANLGYNVTLTTLDGINYKLATNWNVVIDGVTVTATGKKLSTTGTGAYSVINGGDFIGTLNDVVHTRVKITAPNLIDGTRVRIYNMTLDTEVDNSVVSGGAGYIHIADIPTVDLVDGNTVRLQATYCNGLTAKKELESFGILTTAGLLFIDEQEDWTEYIEMGIDGSTVTEFSDDYPDLQVDINDPDNITNRQRLIAWWIYNLTTLNGIRYFFKGITTEDISNYRVNTSIVDLYLDNVNTSPLKFSDNARLYKDDGSSIIADTSNSIQMDSGKVYVKALDELQSNVNMIKGEVI